jgi:hypothetical protein
MNILLWILQILLAAWNAIGGVYTISNFEKIRAPRARSLPKPVWIVLGSLQVLFALGLVLPGAIGSSPRLAALSAAYLAVNALSGCALAAQYAGFPGMLWGVIPALLAAFVAYGRM